MSIYYFKYWFAHGVTSAMVEYNIPASQLAPIEYVSAGEWFLNVVVCHRSSTDLDKPPKWIKNKIETLFRVRAHCGACFRHSKATTNLATWSLIERKNGTMQSTLPFHALKSNSWIQSRWHAVPTADRTDSGKSGTGRMGPNASVAIPAKGNSILWLARFSIQGKYR